jgi:tetratricopeptide (TPR) repeat protein
LSIKSSYSQNDIDSLHNAIKLIKEDSSKINTLKEIGTYYINNEPDSTIFYNEKIIQIAQKYNDDLNIVKHKASAYMSIGYIYYIQKEFTLSKKNYSKAILFFKRLKDNEHLIQCYGNLANDYLRLSNYDSALVNYNNNLNLSIQIEDSLSELYNYINIGTVYLKIGEFEKALNHFIKSLKISEKLQDERLQSICLNSIGVVYWNMQELNTALDYFNKSIAIKN